MTHSTAHHAGLTLGAFLGLVHLVWAVLMWLGWAVPLMNWKLGLHGLALNYSLTDFSFGHGTLLIIVGALAGYVLGFILGTIWEKTA